MMTTLTLKMTLTTYHQQYKQRHQHINSNNTNNNTNNDDNDTSDNNESLQNNSCRWIGQHEQQKTQRRLATTRREFDDIRLTDALTVLWVTFLMHC